MNPPESAAINPVREHSSLRNNLYPRLLSVAFSNGVKLKGAVFVFLIICLFSLPARGQYGGGSGTTGDPYLISDANDMNEIGANSGDWGSYFLLTADINLAAYTGTSFNIIGNDVNAFTGVFNGNSHTISNFTYDSNWTDYIGLFGYIDDPNAEIKNLGLIDPNVDAGTYVGSLVGWLENGTIAGCYAEGGRVSGDDVVGGLVGQNWYGTVTNCYAMGDVNGVGDVGGLVGENYYGTVSNCYAMGNVSEGEEAEGGGIGGLVGYNLYGTVSNSYATGDVNGVTYAGGLVGLNAGGGGTVSNCYAVGDVNGVTLVGGLVGYNAGSTVSNCYSAGDVNGVTGVGGLVGSNFSGTVTDSFWDVNTSGQASSAGGTGKTTAEMQTESTFTDAGWDFVGEVINGTDDIWRMCVDGVNYPALSWQFALGDFVCPDGVNFIDFAVLGLAWRSEQGDGNWNQSCDISEPNDNVIDTLDLDVFTDNWLWVPGWTEQMMVSQGGGSFTLEQELYSSTSTEPQTQPIESEPLDIEQILKLLSEIWLDEGTRKAIDDEDVWLKFIESIESEL